MSGHRPPSDLTKDWSAGHLAATARRTAELDEVMASLEALLESLGVSKEELADLLSSGGDVDRQALEALALESYRAGRLTKADLRRLLGFDTRYALDGFLKAHDVYEDYTEEDLERERGTFQRLSF
jgi:hypothetical protein